MPKLSQLKTASQLRDELLRDPEVSAEWERTALAHAVALRLIRYRVDNDLTQTALSRELGMTQPAIARLEAGDHEPSFRTLGRLASELGMEFHIDITPDTFEFRESA
jgi:DNA-binding XRE family transcriptional regulator